MPNPTVVPRYSATVNRNGVAVNVRTEHGRFVRFSDYSALQSEVEALRKDAERYRWLRSCGEQFDHLAILDGRGGVIAESLDEEIDASLAQSAKGE